MANLLESQSFPKSAGAAARQAPRAPAVVLSAETDGGRSGVAGVGEVFDVLGLEVVRAGRDVDSLALELCAIARVEPRPGDDLGMSDR